MDWLFDHPGVVYLALAIVAVIFVALFQWRRRGTHLIAAAVCVGVMVLFWLLSHWIMTDRKQIVVNVQRMAELVVARKPDELFRYVASDFRYKDMNREQFHDRVQQAMKAHHVQDIYVWDFEIERLSRPMLRAKVNFRASVDATDGGTYMVLIRADFVLEGDTWKIQTMKLFNPVVNQDQPIEIPL
jgi:hypothetical protein